METAKRQNLLHKLHAEIGRLAAIINAPAELLPQRAPSPNGTWITLDWYRGNDGDDPDGWYLSLVRNEDAQDWVLSEVLADHPDYLLYVLFDEITEKLAKDVVGRIGYSDQRAAWFSAQEALLGQLSDDWRARTAQRHAQMLNV